MGIRKPSAADTERPSPAQPSSAEEAALQSPIGKSFLHLRGTVYTALACAHAAVLDLALPADSDAR
jgi:hypothetical protein